VQLAHLFDQILGRQVVPELIEAFGQDIFMIFFLLEIESMRGYPTISNNEEAMVHVFTFFLVLLCWFNTPSLVDIFYTVSGIFVLSWIAHTFLDCE